MCVSFCLLSLSPYIAKLAISGEGEGSSALHSACTPQPSPFPCFSQIPPVSGDAYLPGSQPDQWIQTVLLKGQGQDFGRDRRFYPLTRSVISQSLIPSHQQAPLSLKNKNPINPHNPDPSFPHFLYWRCMYPIQHYLVLMVAFGMQLPHLPALPAWHGNLWKICHCPWACGDKSPVEWSPL